MAWSHSTKVRSWRPAEGFTPRVYRLRAAEPMPASSRVQVRIQEPGELALARRGRPGKLDAGHAARAHPDRVDASEELDHRAEVGLVPHEQDPLCRWVFGDRRGEVVPIGTGAEPLIGHRALLGAETVTREFGGLDRANQRRAEHQLRPHLEAAPERRGGAE